MTNINQPVAETAAKPSIWDKAKPATLRVVIGAVVAAGLIGAAAMIVGEFGPFHLRALLTVFMIVIFSLLVLYDAEVSAKRSHTFAFIGIIVSIYLLITGILMVWIPAFFPASNTYEYETGYNTLETYDYNYLPYAYSTVDIFGDFFQWVWLIIIARFALLHAHLLLNIHRKYSTPLLQLTAKITMGLIALFGLLLSIPHIFDFLTFTDTYWRGVGAIFILDVLGTVLIPLSYALFGPKPEELPTYNQPQRYSRESEPATAQPAPTPAPVAQERVPEQETTVNANQVTPENEHTETQPIPVQTPTTPVVTPAPPVPEFRHAPRPGSVKFETPPVMSRKLAWPRYEDGIPLPILPDGTPDFSAVERY